MSAQSEPDFTPFFKNDTHQVVFEFAYLCVSLLMATSLTAWLHFNAISLGLDSGSKALLLSALGGFIGGWTYSAKWFYRVTARGKDDQYKWRWQPHKFYWRILTPPLAGLIAFDVYLLASSRVLPFVVENPTSGRVAFGLSFVLGHFSDLVLSRCAKWAEKVLGAD